MRCSHTALPCVSSRLVSTPLPNRLFRDPGGRSRAEAEMRRNGNSLNRLTRVANATGRIDQTKRLKTVLTPSLTAPPP